MLHNTDEMLGKLTSCFIISLGWKKNKSCHPMFLHTEWKKNRNQLDEQKVLTASKYVHFLLMRLMSNNFTFAHLNKPRFASKNVFFSWFLLIVKIGVFKRVNPYFNFNGGVKFFFVRSNFQLVNVWLLITQTSAKMSSFQNKTMLSMLSGLLENE